jgi:hypothetical protein
MKSEEMILEQINWLSVKLTKAQVRGDDELARLYDEQIALLQWIIE